MEGGIDSVWFWLILCVCGFFVCFGFCCFYFDNSLLKYNS